jgi:hypothetical protein
MIMGSVREAATGRVLLLQPEHLVGRAPACSLRIQERYVSAQHATLRWSGESWEVKDLGSRNGTFLDGDRLRPGVEYVSRRGSIVAFGRSEQRWELIDDCPPEVMAVPLDGGDPVRVDGDLLALPSSEDPQVTIYRALDGTWTLEQPEASNSITHLQTFEVNGKPWRLCCPENVCKTSLADQFMELEVRHLQLQFSVSRDEEHVHLHVSCRGRAFDLGTRTHNYLLLILARQRLADIAEGFSDGGSGWIYQEDLAHDPRLGGPQLNLDVFRIRKQFAAIGMADAANIVERRPRTKQLRIGASRIEIVAL